MSDENGLLLVEAPALLAAADALEETKISVRLRNGVKVTPAQLRKTAQILSDGPQPFCNGIKSNMPGFIDRDAQTGQSLVFKVGIIPSTTYRIDKLGRARKVPRA